MKRIERRTPSQCPARASALAPTPVRALAAVLLLGVCACNRSADKVADAASKPVAEPAIAPDAAASEPPPPAAQTIRLTPGQAIGRIRVGMTLAELESLAPDWSKQQLDGGTLSLSMSPWRVLVKAGIATEVAFTLEPNILPLVGNTSVRDTSRPAEVAKLFPDCQAPTLTEGVERVACQGGRTLVEKGQSDSSVKIRFVAPPP